MPKLTYNAQTVSQREGETVLDAFLREGISISFSCRGGSCHACLQCSVNVAPPESSQVGLSAEMKALGYFLPCLCVAEQDMLIAPPDSLSANAAPGNRRKIDTIKPDPELWAELNQNDLLHKILVDFYGRVFRDEKLGPFFKNVTEQRLVEKQYSFLNQLISGQKVYFGERPRNAHHWMVISDELFDYRERIMADCLRAHGLDEVTVQRILSIENTFRSDIVKKQPWSRIINGVEILQEGFDEIVLEVGDICPNCAEEIPAGTPVRYHLRLGTISCIDCSRAGAR